MKKQEKILANIKTNKGIAKSLALVSFYGSDGFIRDANRYIKAIKEGRVICSIGSVSRSGMSRTIKFLAPEKASGRQEYQYLNFYAFMLALGFTRARSDRDYFSISGCGMDMIFHTNYTIIHRLQNLGFLNTKECAKLAQATPQVI